MCGFILSFWRLRRLIYSCRVTSKAQLVSPSSVAFSAAIEPAGGSAARQQPALSLAPSIRAARAPVPALGSGSAGPPQLPRCVCYISEGHRQGVIIYFCAAKYTVTFVPRALVTQFLGNTGDGKRSIQASYVPSVLCHGAARRAGREHRRDRTFDTSGDHTQEWIRRSSGATDARTGTRQYQSKCRYFLFTAFSVAVKVSR